MADVQELDAGTGMWVCGQCGDTVTGKVVEPGKWLGHPEEFTIRIPDRVGVNVPCGHDAMALHYSGDDDCLRRAARILMERSKRPDSIVMRALRDVLHDTADAIEAEHRG